MNIDELLKESFKDFKPEAPDVWSSVNGQLGQAPVGSGAAAGGVKSASLIVKVVLALSIPASVLVGYNLLNKDSNTEVVQNEKVATTVQAEQAKIKESSLPEPKVLNEKEQPTSVVTQRPEPTTEKQIEKPKAEILLNTSSMEVKNNTSEKQVVLDSKVESKQETPSRTPNVSPKQKPKMYDRTAVINSANEPEHQLKQENEIFIPNVFTPANNDGVNDRFVIPIEREVFYHLVIYDQSGKLVFESDNRENTWTGMNKNNGQMCEEGSYLYVFQYQIDGESRKERKGTVKLIR